MGLRTHSNRSGLDGKRGAKAGVDAEGDKGKKSQRKDLDKRPDMTWHDHLVMLLHFGAEIEHALMVQYLYTAYSIGGEHLSEKHRAKLEGWRSSIITVAKEEMAHLLTVQNVLTLLGAPLNFDRGDFPYDLEYYPFPSSLSPFSKETLCRYIYAEMPPPQSVGVRERNPIFQRERKNKKLDQNIDVEEQKRMIEDVVRNVHKQFPKIRPHRVGELYEQIIELISDPRRIPDSAFNDETYAMQASWDEWGRGYKPAPRALDAEGSLMPESPDADGKPNSPGELTKASERDAHLLIERMATRTRAIEVLKELAGQGEAPHLRADQAETGEFSHFDRFLYIYKELDELEKELKREHRNKPFKPALNVPTNPVTRRNVVKPQMGDDVNKRQRAAAHGRKPDSTLIEAKCAGHLADLFNQRYRMMLSYLEHSFRLARTDPGGRPGLRAMVMHRVFGEMYNLKTLAGLLVRLPLRDNRTGGCAGPPFEMPYSLNLPQADKDVWRRHLDLLGSAQRTCHALLGHTKPKHESKDGEDRNAGQTHRDIFDAAYDEIYDDIHGRTDRAAQDTVAEQLKRCGGDTYLKTLLNLDDQTRTWMKKILGADEKNAGRRRLKERADH